jgi:hypothetical protein
MSNRSRAIVAVNVSLVIIAILLSAAFFADQIHPAGTFAGTSGLQNGVFVESTASITSDYLAKLVTGNMFNVFILVGEWRAATHTIDYSNRGGSSADMASLIHTIKSYDSRFKVYAWVCWDLSTSNKVDLSKSSYRSTMYSQVTSCLAIGFDGYNDD